jgi:hypothetical protein
MQIFTRHVVRTLSVTSLVALASACAATTTGGGFDSDSGTPNPQQDGSTSQHPDSAMSPPGVDAGNNVTPDGNTTGNPDAPMACNPVAQTGCAAADKCTIDNSGNAVCATNAAAPKMTGATCGAMQTDDCVAGDLCSADAQNAPTLCQQFCSTDTDCKQPAVASGSTAEPKNVGHCLIGLQGSSYQLCTVACNPVPAAGASGCPTGLNCEVAATSSIPELTACRSPGMVAEGATCSSAAPCAAGLVCVGASAAALHCRAVCRAGMNADCTIAGDTCAVSSSIANPMFGACCPASGC